MNSGNLGTRLSRLEKAAAVTAALGAAECQCRQVRGVSGLRIVFEEDGASWRGEDRIDDVEVCRVCGRLRPAWRVVFGEVNDWRVGDDDNPAEVAEAAVEAARGMLDPGSHP